ncbi:MAG: AAA family ATPase, partial [Pseudonocardiales bacterium]|nr:AAA family ATPase [Pseudonocardiales bacterium]
MSEDGFRGFSGREGELSTLAGAFADACSGRPSAVLVSGSAGVGKTRLAEELARHARGRGAIVLSGGAVDIADAPPFWPVLSAVRHAARREPDEETATLLRGRLARLRGADAETAGQPVRLLDLLVGLVVDLAALRPVVLVVEDLQWADRSTRDLVTYLVANLLDEPVLVLATVRTDGPGRTPDVTAALAELHRLPTVTALELQPFRRDVLAGLVDRWAPGRPELEQLVWRRSEGNAFIAEETVRAVLAGDAEGVPATLRGIVLGRVALLSPAAQQVVRALATGVGPLPHRLVAETLDLAPAALHGALREAVAHGIVHVEDAGDRYRLRHGLMTEVVSADLLPGERTDLHRRFALALADALGHTAPGPGLAAQLAHHWYEADEPERALPASTSAAEASEAVHAHAEAHRHWLRAAELVDRVPAGTAGLHRADCLDRAARAAALAGDHDEAVALLGSVLGDPATASGLPAALLTARTGSSLLAAGRTGDALRSYREAADLLPTTGAEAERAQVLAGYSAALLVALDFTAARAVARQALELARAAGADTVEARILAVLGFSSAYLADAEGGAAAINEALEVAERTGEPEAVGEAHLRRAELMTGPLNQLVEGIAFARGGVDRMRELGLARTAGVALLTHVGNALFRLGRWDEAAQAVAEAWALGPTGAAALEVRLARVRLHLGRGELDAATADLEVVDLLARTTAGPRLRIPLLVLFAARDLWRGDPVGALGHVERGLDVADAGADDIWALAPLVWHGTWARADAVAAGHPDASPALVERLRHHRAELSRRAAHTVPGVRAVVEAFTSMCAAETARAERAPDPAAWERLVGLWDRHRQPYPAAYARLRHAEALLTARPRGAGAAGELREAGRVARALGARPLLD